MTKEKLIETIHKLLKTDQNLSFLIKLEQSELEKLVVLVRDRLDYATHTNLFDPLCNH